MDADGLRVVCIFYRGKPRGCPDYNIALRDWGKTGKMGSMDRRNLPLEVRVDRFIQEERLIAPGERVLVAVSGGADSVALLLILISLREAREFEVTVAHYEHGIRGEASRADARFVQALCEARGIDHYAGSGDVPQYAAEWKCSLEDAARRARYGFLERTAERAGARKIALAHQMEDQAETLLLHLVHGCGLQGLGGMRPIQGNRIRPLLETRRAEIEAYLTAKGVPWREDATNADTAHARNLLRGEVFPLLRRLNPRVSEAMARTAGLAAQAADALEAEARQVLAGRVRHLSYGTYAAMDGVALTPVAARALAKQAGVPPLDAAQSLALCGLAPSKTLNLPGCWRALRTRERLHLLRPDPPPVAIDERLFTRQAAPLDGDLGDGVRSQVFDADALEGAVFRARRAGDTFAPLGMEGTQRLKQTLRDAGVDRPFRDELALLARGERVLWIVGLKPSRDAAVGPGTRRAVRIVYHGALPWEIIQGHNGGEKR